MNSKKKIIIAILIILLIGVVIYGIIRINKNDKIETNEYPELKVEPDGEPNKELLQNVLHTEENRHPSKNKDEEEAVY